MGNTLKKLVVCVLVFLFLVPHTFAQITTSVAVPPRAQDFQNNLTLVNTQEIYEPDTEISYQIEYGSYLNQNFSFTLTAAWTQGTIEGNSNPSVDVLDYVVGSATTGFNSTAPVVDSVNNKITWEFNSFPANTTDKTVEFKLKTNSSYKDFNKVNFTVSSKLSAGGIDNTSDLTNSYLYPVQSTQATSTQTPTPTVAPTSSITPTPAPLEVLSFEDIEVRTITNETASIFVQTSKPAKLLLTYGPSSNFSEDVSTSNFSTSQILNLEKLRPNTQYYFKVFATDENGKQVSSDIFTFKTALSPSSTAVDLTSIVVVSGNNLVFDNRNSTSSAQNLILIPQNTNFQFKFSIAQGKIVKNLKLIFRKLTGTTVLGASTINLQANAASVSLVEVEKGTYSVALSSNIEPGIYQLLVSFVDSKGNLNEQEIATLKITNPLTILGQEKNPIEGARVFLHFYHETEKRYIPVSSSFINIQNPSFADSKGVVDLVLPRGKYKAIISNLGFKEKTVFFEINQSEKSGYPIVYLEKTSINIISLIRYYSRSFEEVFLVRTIGYFTSLQNSIRFFDFVALASLLSLAALTLLSFSKRNYIALNSLFSYFIFLIRHKKGGNKYITGKVVDEDGKEVPFSNVYLTNVDEEKIVKVTSTNSKGEFFFRNKLDNNFTIMAMRKGYKSTEQMPYSQTGNGVEIVMEKKEHNLGIIDHLIRFPGELLGMSFEVLIFISLIFELIFIPYFGIVKTAPFIMISIFNLLLWTLHIRHNLVK